MVGGEPEAVDQKSLPTWVKVVGLIVVPVVLGVFTFQQKIEADKEHDLIEITRIRESSKMHALDLEESERNRNLAYLKLVLETLANNKSPQAQMWAKIALPKYSLFPLTLQIEREVRQGNAAAINQLQQRVNKDLGITNQSQRLLLNLFR
ncbi:MAG TPA: hypothetical protein VGL56_20915 [Fimbriimonadaceae bacterium]|jgi:hypothetical protein